ncbi:MAG: AI-2E family transporter [Coprococcus sp.]
MKEEFKKYLAMILAVFCTAALSILFFFLLFRASAIRELFHAVLNILTPFVYGAGIAYVLKPICNTYERLLNRYWHPKRKNLVGMLSVTGSMITGLVIVYVVLSMLLPQLAVSVTRMARSLPSMIDEISAMVDHLFDGNLVIQSYIAELSDAGTESLSEWLKNSILPYLDAVLTGLSNGMINVAGIFMDLLIGLVVAVYLLANRRKFKKQGKLLIYSIFSERWAEKIVEEIKFTDRVFSGFIGGKLLDSAIIGVICYIAMLLLKMPYAVLISVIVGVTNIIPFFGPYIGAIPSAIILLTVSPMDCLIFVVFIVILQQVDGNIIGPRILGNSTGLSGIWVLFAILLFGGLFGFVGMIIGVPVFAVIYDILRKLIIKGLRLRKKEGMFREYEAEYPRK